MQELATQAVHERTRLHDSLFELRDRVRESVNPSKVVHSHLIFACVLAGLAGLTIGYLVTSGFTRK